MGEPLHAKARQLHVLADALHQLADQVAQPSRSLDRAHRLIGDGEAIALEVRAVFRGRA